MDGARASWAAVPTVLSDWLLLPKERRGLAQCALQRKDGESHRKPLRCGGSGDD